jgi:hypothetical protein
VFRVSWQAYYRGDNADPTSSMNTRGAVDVIAGRDTESVGAVDSRDRGMSHSYSSGSCTATAERFGWPATALL